MTWWRRLRLWLHSRRALIALTVRLDADLHAAQVRDRQRAETEQVLRQQVAEFRREVESLNAANESLIVENQQERVWGNTVAHRNAAAFQLADRLPPDLAVELRARLSPTFPSAPEEAVRAR